MLGLFKPKPKSSAEQIKEDRQKWLEDMLSASYALKKLINSDKSGWGEFCALINDYMDKAKKRKAITALDRATPEEIEQLKYLDHEIYLLTWILKMPEQFINKIELEVKKSNEAE